MGLFESRERKNFTNCKSRIALENGFRKVTTFRAGVAHHRMQANYKMECSNNPEGKWAGPTDSLSESDLDDPSIAWILGCGTCKLVDQRLINKSTGPLIDTVATDVVIRPREDHMVQELPKKFELFGWGLDVLRNFLIP